MAKFFKIGFLFFALLLICNSSSAQANKTKPQKDEKPAAPDTRPSGVKLKVQQLIQSYVYLLNVLGDSSTDQTDKRTITQSSFQKLFIGEQVQVEDDLDPDRLVSVKKPIQAYLQDLDFFYKMVMFEYQVSNISELKNDKGETYYKVSTTRAMRGISYENDTIQNAEARYIEINYDSKTEALKIASIYSTPFTQADDLLNWWKNLDAAWRAYFKEQFQLNEDASVEELTTLISKESLDISNRKLLRDVDPLYIFSRLKSLKISKSGITDLSAVRGLVKLESLYIDSTRITNLRPLQYCYGLRQLSASNSGVWDISPLKKCILLQKLDISNSLVKDLAPLSVLVNLQWLNIAASSAETLPNFKNLNKLSFIDISKTRISNISSLSDLPQLSILRAENSAFTDLAALNNSKNLKEIYLDNSSVSENSQRSFMLSHPQVLLVANTAGLQSWWQSINPLWKQVLKQAVNTTGDKPGKESLARIARLETLNLKGNNSITDLGPLRQLYNLKNLNIASTRIKSLEPISQLQMLEQLDFSNTNVYHISILENMGNLQLVHAENCNMDSCEVESFLTKKQQVNFIYKTQRLQKWWDALNEAWKATLLKSFSLTGTPNIVQLHKMVNSDSLTIEGQAIYYIQTGISEFKRLRKIKILNTSLQNLDALSSLIYLEEISVWRTPITSIDALSDLYNLQKLSIENTAVVNLDGIKYLRFLKVLDISGTPINNIKELSGLIMLRDFNCSNTGIKSLDALDEITSLRQLQAFNTKLSSNDIKRFQKQHPNCKVLYY